MKNQVTKAISSLLMAFTLSTVGFQSYQADEIQPAKKPIIGINTDVEGEMPEKSGVQGHYLDAIRKAGGIPVLLPPMSASDLAAVLPHIDGVLMVGGPDYPPSLYHQEAVPSVSLMKASRSDFDMILVKAVLADKTMPFLGICAGCQALNIASGGSLTQDIPSQKPESKIVHSNPQATEKVGFNKHPVEIDKDSKLASVLEKTEMNVVSSHHQCVDKPGEGLTITAHSPDGVPEAIEKTGSGFVLGVQWHPERDFDSNHRLFEELVQQSMQRHNLKSVAAVPTHSAGR